MTKASQKNSSETSSELPVTRTSLKDRIKLVLKFALVGGVFFLLFKKGLITKESADKLLQSPGIVVACVLLAFLNALLGAVRWHVLLRTQEALMYFVEVLRLSFIGMFFNIALPGAVSGDFVKAWYVSKKFPDLRAKIFGSMLFDRILGVSAMVFLATGSAIFALFFAPSAPLPTGLLYSVIAFGIAVALFFVYLFITHSRDPIYKLLKWFTEKNEKLGSIERLYLGVTEYRKHPLRVMKAIALSMVIHLLLVMIAFLITATISDVTLPLRTLAVIVPIGMLATAIPILPAGVGTGHAAFIALFTWAGSTQGADVFSWIIAFNILVGLVGGVVYLRQKGTPSA